MIHEGDHNWHNVGATHSELTGRAHVKPIGIQPGWRSAARTWSLCGLLQAVTVLDAAVEAEGAANAEQDSEEASDSSVVNVLVLLLAMPHGLIATVPAAAALLRCFLGGDRRCQQHDRDGAGWELPTGKADGECSTAVLCTQFPREGSLHDRG